MLVTLVIARRMDSMTSMGIDYVHHLRRGGLPEARYRATYPVKREETKRGATHNAAVEEPPRLTVRA